MKKSSLEQDDIDWYINEKPLEKYLKIEKNESLVISKSERLNSERYFNRTKKIV